MALLGNTFGRQWKLLKRSPPELKLLYVLNFLNSYKYFSMALVLPLIATGEYGLSDTQAGGLYGSWGLLITVWGFIASVMVDKLGVRTTAIFSTFCSVLARFMFVFCRSQRSLYIAVLVLSPMGDGTFDPCFNVGLKKCTNDLTRPFAYACAYTVMNLGGAFCDSLTDVIRRMNFVVMGTTYSGLRCVLFSSLVLMVVAFILSCTLRELTDVEAERTAAALVMTPPTRSTPEMRKLMASRGSVSPGSASAIAFNQNRKGLKKSSSTISYSSRRVDSPRWVGSLGGKPNPTSEVQTTSNSSFLDPNFWRVVVFTIAILFTSQQWRYIDLVMPKLATRNFGDGAPFATLQSINFWGCVLFPPIISSLTSGKDDLMVMLPGIWIMSLSSLPLLFYDSINMVALWIALMTLGEVIWSPRSSSYAASMAPEGREGMFLMLCSWPVYLTKYPAGIFSGWLLSQYAPDCGSCKNKLDNFCDEEPYWKKGKGGEHMTMCLANENKDLPCHGGLINDAQSCAQTCRECPGWTGDIHGLFMWVFFLAIISPIIITLLYPCLKKPTTLFLPVPTDDEEATNGSYGGVDNGLRSDSNEAFELSRVPPRRSLSGSNLAATVSPLHPGNGRTENL